MLRRNGKDVFGDDFEHRAGITVLQPRPAHILIRNAAAFADLVLAGWKDTAPDRFAKAVGLVFFAGMRVIKAAHEQQVRDLLDDFERIGDAARPKGIPDPVDL
jgi:hypothetical protein